MLTATEVFSLALSSSMMSLPSNDVRASRGSSITKQEEIHGLACVCQRILAWENQSIACVVVSRPNLRSRDTPEVMRH